MFQNSALPVLLAGRALIHGGWRLLNHPLYGNFRPHQQPYRSLLLQSNPKAASQDDGLERVTLDRMSLHLIEEAINLYRSVPVLDPDQAPAVFREDCALLDFELMRLPLDQAGWAGDFSGLGG